MDRKNLALVQLVGALIAGYLAYQVQRWDTVVLAVVFLIMAHGNYSGKK